MKHHVRFVAMLVGVAIAIGPASAADIPKLIIHQGYLTDKSGAPVTASLAMSFGIYKSAGGDDLVWEEDVGQVNVTGGHYAIEIGKTAALDTVFFNDSELYLEIRVKGKKMTPRQRIGAVPYAFVAQDVVGDIHPKSVTVGGSTVVDSSGKWVGDMTGLGTVKSVATAAPLSGGPITDTGTISLPKADAATSGYLSSTDYGVFAAKQDRVSGTCNAGFCAVAVNVNGSLVCEPCGGSGAGTVTTVNTGPGLTGGPITQSGTVSLDTTYLDGSAYDSRFVNTAGDTMAGALALPAGGLSVGTNQLVCKSDGKIGIGTSTPQAALDIRGDILIPMADTVVDCDGSATAGVGVCDTISDGDVLIPVKNPDDNLCTDDLTVPTIVFLHTGTKTTQCKTTDGNVIAILGTPAASTQYTPVDSQWAHKDNGTTPGFYDNGEDLYIDKPPIGKYFSTSGGNVQFGSDLDISGRLKSKGQNALFFGGMYEWNNSGSSCVASNPLTGSCTCSSGFSNETVFQYSGLQLHLCYR